MSENNSGEVQPNQPEVVNVEPKALVIVVKIIVTILFVLPLVHYTWYKEVENDTKVINLSQINADVLTIKTTPSVKIRKRIPPPPKCLLNKLEEVQKINDGVVFNATKCTKADFNNMAKHKLPPRKNGAPQINKDNEKRGNIVGFFSALLLIMSLGAAFIELYKAKLQNPVKQAKAPFNRKCSLADLTVLKHHRKELVRRESIMEMSTSDGDKFGKPSLFRRSSAPEDLAKRYFSRTPSPLWEVTVPRRFSVMYDQNSRKLSLLPQDEDSLARRYSFGNDFFAEKKHGLRLVHRH